MQKTPEDRPMIEATLNGPYRVKSLNDLRNAKGERIKSKPVMILCRCGGARNKPFCDGTHIKIGFQSGKSADRVPDRMDHYQGKNITIHDNRGVCAHAAYCTTYSPGVFDIHKRPWINPDGADPEETAATIRMCPSGALSYSKDETLYKNQNRKPAITVSKDGPYHVVGGPELKDPEGSQPESNEHYTLCRCGGSRNKPFCDGTHRKIGFHDEKNG